MVSKAVGFHSPRGARAGRPRYSRRVAGATLNRRCFRSNLASFVYFDPFGDRWLWYKKNSRGVMVPNSGAGRVDSFSWRGRKVRLGVSAFIPRGEPEPPEGRARGSGGLKERASFVVP